MRSGLEQTSMGVQAAQDQECLRLLINYWDTVTKTLATGPSEDEPSITVTQVLKGDRNEMEVVINENIKELYVSILNLLECGLANHPELYKSLRSKILDLGNDSRRDLCRELDNFHILKIREQIAKLTIKRN